MIERLLSLIDAIAQRRVAVIGDVIADEFIYGQLSRVSREAPVLILKYDGTTVLPGGAGNAATNVASLGGRAQLVGLLGYADVDRRMLRALPRGVNRSGLIRSRQYHAPVKTRILAGGSHSTRQQVVRVDREASTPIDAYTRTAFEQAVRQSVMDCDAVLVSDYGSGLVTPNLVSLIKRVIKRSGRRPAVPVVVDSRFELLRYRGVTACTPNESEVEQALGVTIGDDSRCLERAGRTLLRRLKSQGIVLTRGSRGMAVFVPGKRTVHVPVFGTDEVADVTGAGDSLFAALSVGLCSGSTLMQSSAIAAGMASLAVQHVGNIPVSYQQLKKYLSKI